MTKSKKCPICRRPAEAAFMPFCSKRCADVDLGNWFGEGYKMPVEDMPSSDDFLEQ